MQFQTLTREIKLTQSNGKISTINLTNLNKEELPKEKINLNPYELFNQGLMLEKSIPTKEVINLIDFIKYNYEPVELIRIGSIGDGGYLFPDIFKEVNYCFSPGVSNIACFEEHLANKYNIKCFFNDSLATFCIFLFSEVFINSPCLYSFFSP